MQHPFDHDRYDAAMADLRRTAEAHSAAITECMERIGKGFRQLGAAWEAWLRTDDGQRFLTAIEATNRRSAVHSNHDAPVEGSGISDARD